MGPWAVGTTPKQSDRPGCSWRARVLVGRVRLNMALSSVAAHGWWNQVRLGFSRRVQDSIVVVALQGGTNERLGGN